MLLLLLPVFVLVAVAVRLESGGPVLFKQKRTGFNHKPFTIFKFRTMTTCENGNDVRQAVRNDPRFTRIGAFLRRTSIDELPQLLNVLRGDMSLVGPRPHALSHDKAWAEIIESYPARYNMKPGITGLAQVLGHRGEIETDAMIADRVNCDLRYIENWSFWLDMRIVAKTIAVFAFQKSAY